MAESVLVKDLACWLGGYDLTSHLDTINIAAAKAELSNKRYGDSVEAVYPGLEQINAEAGGFNSSEDSTGPDPVIWSRIDPTATPSGWPLLVVPPYSPAATPNTFGNTGYLVTGNQFAYNFSGNHGELLKFATPTRLASTFELARQTVMAAKAAVSVTTTGTGKQLGALSASQKMVVSFHVFSISGTGQWTLTIQSDDNSGFTSATTRDTFTSVDEGDDPTSAIRTISGAVTDDWWRAVLTEDSGTSTITYAVSMGIK